MSALSRPALNAAFTAAFLIGAYWVWSALAALVLGRPSGWPPAVSLSAGLIVWVALALRTGRAT